MNKRRKGRDRNLIGRQGANMDLALEKPAVMEQHVEHNSEEEFLLTEDDDKAIEMVGVVVAAVVVAVELIGLGHLVQFVLIWSSSASKEELIEKSVWTPELHRP
jgi:hypothetical protein